MASKTDSVQTFNSSIVVRSISLRRVRLATGVSQVLAILSPAFALHAWWMGASSFVFSILSAVGVFLLIGAVVRKTGRYALMGHLIVAILFALVFIGQVTAPELQGPWPILLALVAPPLLGPGICCIWVLPMVGLVTWGQWAIAEPEALALQVLSLLAISTIAITFTVLRRRTENDLKAEIAERKNAEQEARAADLAKGEFLANMSHELRTPLNAVIGFADLLGKEALTEKQLQRVDGIHSGAEMLLSLVDEVLDLAKIEAGKLTLTPHDFRPRALADEVMRVLEPKAREKGLEFRVEFDPDLPDTARGDATRLRQILINLVGNAVKFTSRGSVVIRLDSTGREGHRHWTMWTVTDTGIGMSIETQDRIFSPFSQADSSAGRRFGGTGLGLAISKRLAELMGGEIGCKSQRGKGSTFWVRLPLDPPIGEPLPSEDHESGPLDWQGARLLVVEDNPINRLVLVEQLRVLGFEPDVAEDGAEALELFERQRHDVVLMDCQLPVIDGYEATRRLRRFEKASAESKRTVVIAVTAHALRDERERCLAAGMNDYLSKPFRGEELKILLERWLVAERASVDEVPP